MKRAILLLLFLGCTIDLIYAQDVDNTVPSTISAVIEQAVPTVDARFAVVVTRQEFLLEATPFLREYDGGEFGNAAQVVQIGDYNVTLLEQYGEQNVASIRLEGNDNVVNALQEGNENLLDVSVLGNDNWIPVTQRNDGNALILDLTNVHGLRFPNGTAIEQTGGGVPVIIRLMPGSGN